MTPGLHHDFIHRNVKILRLELKLTSCRAETGAMSVGRRARSELLDCDGIQVLTLTKQHQFACRITDEIPDKHRRFQRCIGRITWREHGNFQELGTRLDTAKPPLLVGHSDAIDAVTSPAWLPARYQPNDALGLGNESLAAKSQVRKASDWAGNFVT
jgi:hypothetical protein